MLSQLHTWGRSISNHALYWYADQQAGSKATLDVHGHGEGAAPVEGFHSEDNVKGASRATVPRPVGRLPTQQVPGRCQERLCRSQDQASFRQGHQDETQVGL